MAASTVDDALRGEINALIEASSAVDGLRTEIDTEMSINAFKDMACAFSCRVNDTLVGFLFVFAPSPDIAEISALVHPAYRGQGVFRAMQAAAIAEAARYGYRRVLYLCPEQSVQAQEWMARRGYCLHHVEFQMRYDIMAPAPSAGSGLRLVRVSMPDIDGLAPLLADVFGQDEAHERAYLARNIGSSTRKQWMLQKDGCVVGFCGVSLEDGLYYVYGLGILPAERHKGYARAMLALVVGDAVENGVASLKLEVDSDNPEAIGLYRSFGFTQQSATHYHEFQF